MTYGRRHTDARISTPLGTLASILGSDIRSLKLIAAPLSVLASIGFFVQMFHDPYEDLKFMIDVFPWWVWSLAFLTHGVARFIGLFGIRGWHGSRWTNIIFPFLGAGLWSFTLASSAILSPMEGMSILYTIPAFMEMWILARAIIEFKKAK